MKIPDDERRQLDEIEKYLAQESPWLAAELRRHRTFSVPVEIAGTLAAISAGLAAAVMGTETGWVILAAGGLSVAVGVPTAVVARYLAQILRW